MQASPVMKFSDIQKERFKQHELSLKYTLAKQKDQLKAKDGNYCSSPTWPSVSSIHPDVLDVSCTTGFPSLHVSRVESEVVSSSTNLRQKLPMHKPIATSSVKKYPMQEFDKDRAIMPPPSITVHNVKKSSNSVVKHNAQDHHSDRNQVDEGHNSSAKKSLGSSVYQENNSENSELQDSTNHRVFSRWRVHLNKDGQLIIKGVLRCGRTARSKPVIQRFTSTKVQSIYKHIYVLEGNIVDDKNELPEYVRGKFHNGFPDDWENVYQLWRNFIAEGSKITFRWPTPVTDSDDDLNSDITEFMYYKNKKPMITIQDNLKPVNNNTVSSGYQSKTHLESQDLEKSNEERMMNTNQNKNSTVENSSHSIENTVKENSACKAEIDNGVVIKDAHGASVNYSNSSFKNSSFLYEIIREDKLRIILSNLGNKNCDQQYLDKFIELIDCLRYLLSYTLIDNCEKDIKKQNVPPLKSQICQKCNSTNSCLETQENVIKNSNEPEQCNVENNHKHQHQDNNQIEYSENNYNYNNSKNLDSDIDVANKSSDSDVYMGIPNVSLNLLLKSKTPRSERYKNRINRSRDRKDISKDNQVKVKNENIKYENFLNQYDSSVSITEDECGKQQDARKCDYIKMLPPPVLQLQENQNEGISTNHTRMPSTPKKLIEKHKPIIKAYETVNYNIKIKHAAKNHNEQKSDISVINDELMSTQQEAHPKSFRSKTNESTAKKINADYSKHPFLTYDSEDFLNEKEIQIIQRQLPGNNFCNKIIEKKNSDSTEKNQHEIKRISENISLNQESQNKIEKEQILTSLATDKNQKVYTDTSNKTATFGSKENPKLLSSWIPYVTYDDERLKNCSLRFEGKLLNEAGHVLNRKFVTETIHQRHSSKLVETINNEFFLLVGDLNNAKHVVPRELVKQCRTGCPTKINEFCEEWKKSKAEILNKPQNLSNNVLNASIELFSIPTSSRGRRIVPSLNYWEGERLLSVENETIYKPGLTTQTIKSSINNAITDQSVIKKESPAQYTNKEKSKLESTTKTSVSNENTLSKKLKKKTVLKRIAKEKESKSSGDDEPKIKRIHNKNSQVNQRQAIETRLKQIDSRLNPETTVSNYNSKLRKRQKVESIEILDNLETNTRRTLSRKDSAQLTWSYCYGPSIDDLSEDQISTK